MAFTEADLRGREYVTRLMREAGLEVRVDDAGNLSGRRQGLAPGSPSIVLGSHIDTVPLAGAYDGVLGVMAAIECVQVLGEHGFRARHPLEVIVFANEEGGLTGSRALAGRLNVDALEESSRSGLSIRQGIAALGGNADRISRAILRPGEVKAYLELHIEQGGSLESEGIDIGIVEGFVGIRWWDVTVTGVANHAGTTPMNARQDALLAAAKLVIGVEPGRHKPARKAGGHGGAHHGRAGSSQRDSRTGGAEPGAARSGRNPSLIRSFEEIRRRAQTHWAGDKGRNRVHRNRHRGGADPDRPKLAGGDPGSGRSHGAELRPAAQRGRPRRPEYGPYRSLGPDLRPQRGRDQPLTTGIHPNRGTSPTAPTCCCKR